MPHILHIDDDLELGAMLCEFLQGEGFEATHCANPLDGLARLRLGGVSQQAFLRQERTERDAAHTSRQVAEEMAEVTASAEDLGLCPLTGSTRRSACRR